MVPMTETMRRWARARMTSVVLPVAAAVVFVVGMLWLLQRFRDLGLWYPSDPAAYRSITLICGVVIAVGRRIPRVLFFAVAVVVANPDWSFSVGEIRAIPLALTAYLASAAGLRRSVALPVAGVAAVLTQFPYLLGQGWTYLFLASDLSTRWLVIGIVVAAVLLGTASWTKARNAEALVARNVELEQLRESDRERIANEERTAIAREIHDVVAHHVAAIVIRAQAAARVADQRPDEPRAAVEWIATSGKEALSAMRGVVRVLRGAETGGTTEAPIVLAEAVRDVVDRVRATGLQVEADVEVPPGLDALQQFAVLRVCQEALTNVLIHSGATAATVRLGRVGSDVVLMVEDNGAAAPAPSGLGSGGAGLRGMRERADAVGGHLMAGSTGRGWRVDLVVPMRTTISHRAGGTGEADASRASRSTVAATAAQHVAGTR